MRIHQVLSGHLALLDQTISRREILFLFEAYSAVLRAGTEVIHDKAWKEQVRANKGILLSIDGIQPDKGNETIYLLRDVLTGRILNAENVTDSTKERLKQLFTPVVALDLPVIGVGSRCSTNGITSRGGDLACYPPSNLPIACASRSGEADLQC